MVDPDDEDGVRSVPVAARFMGVLEKFLMNVDAMRDLVSIAPTAAQLDEPESRFASFDTVIKEIPRAERRVVAEILRRRLEEMGRPPDDDPPPSTDAVDSVEVFEERQESRVAFPLAPMFDELFKTFSEEEWVGELVEVLSRGFTRPPRENILLQSIITSTVSSYEVLLAGIVSAYHLAVPASLQPFEKEKEFSLEDLKELGSVAEAVELAISRRAEGFLSDGVEDWAKWFDRNLKIDIKAIGLAWEETLEVFERRHTIVHHECSVSRRYRARVESAAELEVGQRLAVGRDYVDGAIDNLVVHGVLLITLSWIRIRKEDLALASATLNRTLYSEMLQGRWAVVGALSEAGSGLECGDELRLIFQCNAWLARKRIDGLDSIVDEVQSWDPAALSAKFRLVRHSLLDEMDMALSLLETALRSEEISRKDAYQWPILAEVRDDSRFATAMGADVTTSSKRGETPGTVIEIKSARVYMGRSSRVFHRRSCRRLPVDSHSIKREAALEKDLLPCRVCRP